MSNRYTQLLAIAVAVLFCGCPTRSVFEPDGGSETGGTAGRGNASGSGGAAGHRNGGAAGNPETGGHGGAGAPGGIAGVAGVGGSSGEAGAGGHAGQSGLDGAGGVPGARGTGGVTATGGVIATGGVTATGGASGAGGAPAGGTGGTDPYTPAYVICGSVTACPLSSGGKCCYAQMDQSSACQVAAASCEPVMVSTGVYAAKTTIQCDSTSDCQAGQICCYTEVYISRSTACAAPSACVDVSSPNPGGYDTYRRQVCDPNSMAPTECLSGSCKVATTYSPALPTYLYLCL